MDKISEKIINYIKQLPNQQLRYTNPDIEKASNNLNISKRDFMDCIDFLIDEKYLKYVNIGAGGKYIRLSYINYHSKEFKKINLKNYLKINLISILALIVSIISLLISFFTI